MRTCWSSLALSITFLAGGLTVLGLGSVIAWAAEGSGNESAREPPRWIWAQGSDTVECEFSRGVDLNQAIQAASLSLAADFCDAAVELNGRPVLHVAPYVQRQTIDVTNWLQRGENIIRVRSKPTSGPSAIAVSLDVQHPNGLRTQISTDGEWRVEVVGARTNETRPVIDLGQVPPEFWGIGRRGIELSPFENYEQWQQAKTSTGNIPPPRFWTAPGFEIAELRTARADEGSWISMAFDSKGRLIIAREDIGFLRFTPDPDGVSIAQVEAIASPLEECRGLVFVDDWLYANANNSRGLYRLHLSNEGRAQDLQLLRQFPGKVGHGRNDLAADRTGGTPRLYSIHGDSVDLPGPPLIDRTSPLNETRRGVPRHEGSLVRTDLEGKQWELICAGLRNPYGIAVHSSGDPFTFDADNEYDMGTPWYRPTRILQLMTGGDHGYREATGILPPRFHDQPDNAPPLLDIGRSSPTAVMFGYDLQFPPPYCNALFALDWTYGRVLAIHLSMRGASWRAAAELFLQGKPLNVTDVAAGPDGAMYLITGGRKTQSALYRVRYVGELRVADAPGAHARDAEGFSKRIRSETVDRAGKNKKELLSGLADPDPVLRHAARIDLERRPIDQWRSLVLDRTPGPEVLGGLLAVARAREPDDVVRVMNRLLQYRPEELDLGSQFVWVRIGMLARQTAAEKLQPRSADLVRALVALWSHLDKRSAIGVAAEGSSDELRRRIALFLGDLAAQELPGLAVPRLLGSPVQEDQLAGLLALRSIRTGWTPALRRRQLEVLNEMRVMQGGQGLPIVERWLRGETLQTLTVEEQRELADVLQPMPVSSEPLPPPRAPVKKWSLQELAELFPPEVSGGDRARGEIVFREALCVRCHRVGLRGAAVGPDLTQLARRFSRRDMLESIVSPSLSVAENYRLEQIVTESGQVFTGRVINEGDYRAELLKLATDPLRPEVVMTIDKKQITEHRSLPTSPMPEGLLDAFTLDEIRDLLAYLESAATASFAPPN